MITLLGGELLSALGNRSEIITTLSTGKSRAVSVKIPTITGQPAYPYYRIDETRRSVDPAIADDYLDQVVNALFHKVRLKPDELSRSGVFLGSSSIDFSLARRMEKDIAGDDFMASGHVGGGRCVYNLMKRFAINGPSLTYHTACTSSANALMDAASMLESGIIDHALVLGLELFLPATLEGFVLMQLLSPDEVRPFDQQRNGMVLGEAVSAILLSRDDVLPSHWHYLGGKSNCETYSVTGADPSGKGIAQVMRAALEDAQITKNTIAAVKAHGTASEQMDLAEMRGMEQFFESIPPYFSLKEYLGHTLGGCGIAELVLTMMSIDAGFIPPTVHCTQLDREFSQAPVMEVMPVVRSGRFMLNYFGFGGNNTSFIIEKTTA